MLLTKATERLPGLRGGGALYPINALLPPATSTSLFSTLTYTTAVQYGSDRKLECIWRLPYYTADIPPDICSRLFLTCLLYIELHSFRALREEEGRQEEETPTASRHACSAWRQLAWKTTRYNCRWRATYLISTRASRAALRIRPRAAGACGGFLDSLRLVAASAQKTGGGSAFFLDGPFPLLCTRSRRGSSPVQRPMSSAILRSYPLAFRLLFSPPWWMTCRSRRWRVGVPSGRRYHHPQHLWCYSTIHRISETSVWAGDADVQRYAQSPRGAVVAFETYKASAEGRLTAR